MKISGNRCFLSLAMLSCCIEPLVAHGESPPAAQELAATVAALDSKIFDAYNQCDMPTFSDFFSTTVEFYHDQGGATFDRESVVANTKKNICGKIRRELVPETLKVYPIKGYGAIEEGEHRFCQIKSAQCEGIAKFVMIWHRKGAKWELTRVLSYGHRSLTDSEKEALGAEPKPK